MNKILTKSQIDWASTHSWFVRVNNDGTITVRDEYSLNGVSHSEEVVWTKSFSELKEFAGY